MKSIVWIVGGAALVSGGVWYWFHYNSAAQKRLRGLAGPGGNSIVSGQHQEAGPGMTPTIFHEPNMEPIGVDLANLGQIPPL